MGCYRLGRRNRGHRGAAVCESATCTLSNRLWNLALVLLIGAILAPNKRTVTASLRIVGSQSEKRFLKYHRVLSRPVWSCLALSQTLLLLLVSTFAADGTINLGVDDTIERRWGLKIKARGIYRDPVRLSHSHFVKASGLRWLCTLLFVPIPWAQRVSNRADDEHTVPDEDVPSKIVTW